MPTPHGQFVWYELMTTDTAAARAFYEPVVGWNSKDVSMPGMNYSLFNVGDTPSAGVMPLMEDAKKAGVPPNWLGYIGVDDVDATAAKVTQLGGKVHHAPTDIPDVGRFAVVADPQSAVFGIMRWATPGPGDMPAVAPMTRGHAGWHQLAANDWKPALDFYSSLFGWTKGEPIDIGQMGTYQLFVAEGRAIGGMFNRPPQIPVPCWQYFFVVGAIEAAVARVTGAGGKVIDGPREVPGGAWVIQCLDPQGAVFSLVGEGAKKS